jgi:hypothetical protein
MDFGMDDDKLERESSCGSTVYFDSMDYMAELEEGILEGEPTLPILSPVDYSVTRQASWGFGMKRGDKNECGWPWGPPNEPGMDLESVTIDEVPVHFHWGNPNNPQRAFEQFKQYLRWRNLRGLDTIDRDPAWHYDLMKEASPHYMLGRTKTGAYVSYELSGSIDPWTMSKKGITQEVIERHLGWQMEFVRWKLENGVFGIRYIVVMDMKGISLTKASHFFMLQATRTYAETITNFYPELLENVFVVNAPWGSGAIVKVMSAVLPRSYAEKVVLLDKNEDLLQYIEADQLHVNYGGNNP